MGSYKYGFKSPNMGNNYTYLTYNPTYNYVPMNPQEERCCRASELDPPSTGSPARRQLQVLGLRSRAIGLRAV